MLSDFQLGALVLVGGDWRLLQIPLHQELQDTLMASWNQQYKAFTAEIDEIAFDAGYTPEEHERFRVDDYELPEWIQAGASGGLRKLDSINDHEGLIESTKAIIAFARHPKIGELMLAQNFSRSHVIQPGQFLFLQKDTYQTTKRPGLTLGNRLTAVVVLKQKKLLFDNFRNTNAFLPLIGFVSEASDQDIRQVLNHPLLVAVSVDHTLASANQWFRKRFALLRASGILDQYSAAELRQRSKNYEVDIKIQKGKVVFPAEKAAAKRLLQFLNEEIFRGAITEKLYETNSKRTSE